MKNLLSFVVGLIVAFTLIPTVAGAVSTQWDWTGSVLRPFQSMWNAPVVVRNVISTSTTETNIFPRALFTQASSTEFCLIGDTCITTWPTGGSGGATTTINGVNGPDFTFATGTATGIGLTISSSTGTLTFTPTVSSGYNIPLTASTTEWANKISSQWITSGSNIYYNTGNVGIGTASPDYKLTVRGSGNDTTSASLQVRSLATLGNTSAAAIVGAQSIDSSGFFGAFPSDYATALFQDRVALSTNSTASGLVLTALSSGQDIRFFSGSTAESMRISSTGNVGIGTTAPGAKLHVVAETRYNFGNEYAIVAADTSNPNQRVSLGYDDALSAGVLQAATEGSSWDTLLLNPNGGNVGIGTTNPTTKLFIKSATGVNSILGIDTTDSGNSTSNATIRLYEASTNKWDIYNDGDAGDLFKIEPTGGTNSLTINSTGNVGIGTSSPRSKLDIWDGDFTTHGRLYVRESDNGNDAVVITRDADEGYVDVYSNGSVVNRIRGNGDSYITSGNVGIGTTSPVSRLTVEQTSAGATVAPLVLNNFSATNGTAVEMRFTPGTNSTRYNGIGVARQSVGTNIFDTYFTTSNDGAPTEKMRILANGNVGIGTASPTSQLEVLTEGVASSRGLTVSQHNSGAQGALINFYKSRGTEASPTVVSNGDYVGVFFARPYDGNEFMFTSSFGFRVNGTVTNDSVPTDFLIATGATNDTGLSNERLRITSAGNVGIGTTTPSHLFTVAGDTNITGALRFGGNAGTTGQILLSNGSSAPTWTATSSLGLSAGFFAQGGNSFGITATLGTNDSQNLIFETSGTERMTITSAGAVGIGTTTPSTRLSVVNPSGGGVDTLPAAGASGGKLSLLNDQGKYGLLFGTLNTGTSFIQNQRVDGTATTYNLLLNPNGGNVGIGTTTPAARLQITGLAGTNPFRVASSSNTSLFEITQLGRVGIGSSTPSHTLTVAGDLNVTGASRISIPRSFTWPGVATTTSATSTVPLGIAMSAEAWTSARCKTTSGTAAWLFKDDAGNRMNGGTASTTSTSTLVTLSTNNTFTTGEGRNADIGPLTNAQITCSMDVTINN